MTNLRAASATAWLISSICGTAVIIAWTRYDFPLWVLLAATGWAMTNIIWATLRTEQADNKGKHGA